MDGMLSQDEINALLNGMSDDTPAGSAESSSAENTADSTSAGPELLSDVEKDAVGEISNISMGTAATTLYSLVNRKVVISTPVVQVGKWEELIGTYDRPCVFIQISYTVGLDGKNILILKEDDVKIITDLMMGGDGTNIDGELGELHLSAISEAMNQMMGSSATSLSSMLDKKIDISTPNASLVTLDDTFDKGEFEEFLESDFVKITFKMEIGDLVDSEIMQLYPINFAKELYNSFTNGMITPVAEPSAPEPEVQAQPAMSSPVQPEPQMAPEPQMQMQQPQMQPQMGMPQIQPQMGMPQMGMPQMQPQMGMPQMMGSQPMQNVNVQPAQFQAFNNNVNYGGSHENIDLIMDVPLEVTVELGRTRKSIQEILDFAPGTIIELNKIAGEPIDVLVNGKLVAKGEVVVIEESFGIRVTEIIR